MNGLSLSLVAKRV